MEAKQLFEQARELAVTSHGDQRYGDKAVVNVLKRFGASLEDTATAPLL